MGENFYSGAIIPETNRLIFENWLNEHNITYSRTEVVERPVRAGDICIIERAFGFLLLMTKDEYDEMIREFGKEINEI